MMEVSHKISPSRFHLNCEPRHLLVPCSIERHECHRPLAPLSILPPHSPSRHNAGCRDAGDSRLAAVMRNGKAPTVRHCRGMK